LARTEATTAARAMAAAPFRRPALACSIVPATD